MFIEYSALAGLLRKFGSDPELKNSEPHPTEATHSVLLVDIQKSSGVPPYHRTQRRDWTLATMRDTVRGLKLHWDDLSPRPTGDGVRLLVPEPAAALADLVNALPAHLEGPLREQARMSRDHPRLKLRLTIHSGLLRWSAEGWSGDALTHVARLDDAKPTKELLDRADAGLALVLSERVFDDVIRAGFGRLPPEAFQEVEVRVKDGGQGMGAPDLKVPQCPGCGGKAPTLRSPGRLVLVNEADVGRLGQLLAGAADVDRCDVCGREFGTAPSVFVLFPGDAVVVYALGPLFASDAVASIDWRPYFGGGDAVPHLVCCPDLDTLRVVVRQRLARRLSVVSRLLDATGRGEGRSYLAEHWRDFEPAVITALTLAVRQPDEHLHSEGSGTDVTLLQASVWLALCREWTELTLPDAPPTTARFAADLARYVVDDALPPAVAETVASGLSDDMDDLSPYVLRAVQAALARAGGSANPDERLWTELFFVHEIACRLGAPGNAAAALVDDDFARETVGYEAAWHAATKTLAVLANGADDALPELARHEAVTLVQAVAEKAGHSSLVAAVLESAMRSALDPDADADEVVRAALAELGGVASPEVLGYAGLHLDAVRPDRLAEVTDEVARRMLALLGQAGKFDVVAWWANRHNRAGRYTEALRLLDDHPVSDDGLAAPTLARLTGERARALAGHGRHADALAIWRSVVDLLAEDPNRNLYHWARVNVAIELAQTGSPDEAFAMFDDIVAGPEGYGADPQLLMFMATLLVRFDRSTRAVEVLAEAERLAGESPVAVRYAYQRAQQLVVLGRDAEAVELLVHLASGEHPLDVPALLAEAASWSMLLARGTALPVSVADRAGRMAELLTVSADAAACSGNAVNHVALLARSAELAGALGNDTGPLWEDVVERRRGYGMADDPVELVRAALGHHRRGDLVGMRELLCAVPSAQAAVYGGVGDLELLVREPRAALAPLAELAGRLMATEGATGGDVRLLAELQRDTVGRARAAHIDRAVAAERGDTWSGATASAIPAEIDPLVVVEWIRTGPQSLRCMATRVHDGEIAAAFLPLAPVDPVVLQRKLAQRLASWGRTRSGSPLDWPAWRELAASMAEALERYAVTGDHVVFLHNDVYANLPWHTALTDWWTVSYAPGWSHLTRMLADPPARPRTLGILAVPLTQDDTKTVGDLRDNAEKAATTATEAGLHVVQAPPERCDRRYLHDMMSRADVALVLCHGYPNARTEEIGLLLAHEGRLPLADSVSFAKASFGHLFSWRDCTELPRAAPTVLSAACSSAHSYGAGLGDRLGLFSGLRQAGTTAMVAPAWNVLATEVLPVLDEVTRRYLAGEPLGQALRTASLTFTRTMPDWLAYSLGAYDIRIDKKLSMPRRLRW